MGITARHLGRQLGDPPNQILSDINLEIQDGEFLALTGRSGSGKSSLLYLLSTLDTASEGKIEIDGREIGLFNQKDLNRFRNEAVGFVFQFHYLLAELTAMENVLMPAQKAGRVEAHRSHALALLEKFGLGDKTHRFPRQLSGGEQQRVAIARALVMKPRYLFADEPTGSLDSQNSELVIGLIRDANKMQNTTVIMVTHDADFAARADRQIHLVDGRLVNS